MRDQISKFTNQFTSDAASAIETAGTNLGETLETNAERVFVAVVDANRRLVEFAVTTADRLVDQLPVEVPFADRFPTPSESGERYLDFVERAVSVNRDFNERVVAMLKSDVPAAADKAASAVASSVAATPAKTTPTRKPVARKAPARKTAARKTAARKSPARKASARKAPARKAPARKAPARTATAGK